MAEAIGRQTAEEVAQDFCVAMNDVLCAASTNDLTWLLTRMLRLSEDLYFVPEVENYEGDTECDRNTIEVQPHAESPWRITITITAREEV